MFQLESSKVLISYSCHYFLFIATNASSLSWRWAREHVLLIKLPQFSLDPSFFQGQRTVYRLTLVKEWNMDEMQGYASLVELGKPDFIEVKVRGPCLGTHYIHP